MHRPALTAAASCNALENAMSAVIAGRLSGPAADGVGERKFSFLMRVFVHHDTTFFSTKGFH
jgi:hypothetical protein